MTKTFVEAFPGCPPYGGAFPDPTPHLTVGSGVDQTTASSIDRAMMTGLSALEFEVIPKFLRRQA
ncbi:MAG: hypothetical protein ABIW84_11130 [Ilumatobacteraceae bacterium]